MVKARIFRVGFLKPRVPRDLGRQKNVVIYLYHKRKLKGFALNANNLSVFLVSVGLSDGVGMPGGKMKNKNRANVASGA